MKRLISALCLMFLAAAPAAAQTCTPTYGWGNSYWSNSSSNKAMDPNANGQHAFGFAVPTGVIWEMRTISVSVTDATPREYFIEHLVNVPPVANAGHYHRIAGGQGSGTPVLHVPPADARALIMLPGEKLAARTNGTQLSGDGMMLFYSYFSLPEACLSRVLGLEAPAAGSSSALAPVQDFSALLNAAATAATALTAFAQSAP